MTAREPVPIEDYALVGDLHTAALVSRSGSVDQLCLPHFDSPACFAALLHDETAGRWLLAPAEGGTVAGREYVDDTLVLRSRWETATGAVDVLDLMPLRGDAADLVRVVKGRRGRVEMVMALQPRFDYGHVRPWVLQHGNRVSAVAGPDSVWVHADVPLEVQDATITARFAVEKGEQVSFVLTHRPSHAPTPEPADADRALSTTMDFWRGWIDRCTHAGPWAADVRRSLLLLKALTYAPTGGIVAAATTSLPEDIGGVRNWDYRYCWLRDATFTLQALLGTGFVAEAKSWREWLVRAVAGDPARLQIMYGLDGSRRLPESDLPWLEGYAGEGAFLICSFWEVDALHGIGRHDEARELYERLLSLRNDVGMLSEQYDVRTGHHLGNAPQSFSLVGLVNSARQLSGASTRTSTSSTRQDIDVGGPG